MSDDTRSSTVAILTACGQGFGDPDLAAEGVALLRGLPRGELESVAFELVGVALASMNALADDHGVTPGRLLKGLCLGRREWWR